MSAQEPILPSINWESKLESINLAITKINDLNSNLSKDLKLDLDALIFAKIKNYLESFFSIISTLDLEDNDFTDINQESDDFLIIYQVAFRAIKFDSAKNDFLNTLNTLLIKSKEKMIILIDQLSPTEFNIYNIKSDATSIPIININVSNKKVTDVTEK